MFSVLPTIPQPSCYLIKKLLLPFMKQERQISSTGMSPQSSYESDQETVSVVLLPQKLKEANEINSVVKPCSETNKFEHHQPREIQASCHQSRNDADETLQQQSPAVLASPLKEKTRATNEAQGSTEEEDSGRERLKRHRVEVAGRVWIPEIWGQEELLRDWIDCSAFDASIMNGNMMSARAALVEEGRRANSSRLRIENRC